MKKKYGNPQIVRDMDIPSALNNVKERAELFTAWLCDYATCTTESNCKIESDKNARMLDVFKYKTKVRLVSLVI